MTAPANTPELQKKKSILRGALALAGITWEEAFELVKEIYKEEAGRLHEQQ